MEDLEGECRGEGEWRRGKAGERERGGDMSLMVGKWKRCEAKEE